MLSQDPFSRRKRVGLRILSVASVAGGLGIWYLLSATGAVSEIALPSPASTWRDFLLVAENGYGGYSLWENTRISMVRVVEGFGLAVLLGVPIGLLMGLSKVVRAVLDPVIEMYRPLPALAYYALLIVWFGTGEVSKVVILALAALPAIILSSAAGTRGVPRNRIEGALALGVSRLGVIRIVILPACVPDIMTGVRVGFAAALTTLVAAEMIASTSGLGFMIFQAGQFAQSSIVIIGMIVIAVVAVVVNWLFRVGQRLAAPWHGRA